uniref:Apolipoprotein n=1 Tax=Musca domestica TaxID=7370 RepID=T1PDZ4_MUSDO
MKHQVIFLSALILLLSFVATQANLFECDDKLATSDATIIGPKIPGNSDEERSGNKVRDVLKEWSCKLKKSTANLGANVKEKTKQWSENIREGFQKLKEKSKDLQKKLQTKYNDLKDNLKKDSAESMEIGEKKLLFKPEEVIDTDVVIIDQKCGNGFILDALGNCKKFREYAEIIN